MKLAPRARSRLKTRMNGSPDITNKIDKWSDMPEPTNLSHSSSPETDREAREEAGDRPEAETGLQRETTRKTGERVQGNQ